ncbi:MarR family transcriptional regulator [Dasania marina]|uniref:MarR family winged helix-turn-helix transcriptional regulator n=1 Tax=Dasania marina TaxID=471499 RepID=UPI0030D9660C|tara:strand:- start:12840 stop:13265 length:426 start_codon:yes stop_codon:yes gene_type:complete
MNINALEATFHLSHAIKQHLGSQLEAKNLNIAPMHVRVLKVINKHQSCTAIDIASFFKRDKAQITRLVKQLIELDFVKKKPNPEDKRSQLLVLTPQGTALQKSLSVFSEDLQKQITQGINAEDLATFVKVAEKMTSNLSNA